WRCCRSMRVCTRPSSPRPVACTPKSTMKGALAKKRCRVGRSIFTGALPSWLAAASEHLEHAGRAHAAADAHRHHHLLRAAALAFDERVAGQEIGRAHV